LSTPVCATTETTPSLLHSIVPSSIPTQTMLAEELAARASATLMTPQGVLPLQNTAVPGTTIAGALLSLLLQERHASAQIIEQNPLMRQWLLVRQQSQLP
jgi:hypothetical protein